MQNKDTEKGRIIIYTGNGKGKTTAAVGTAVRALGRGMKVAMLQFIKSPERSYGEQLSLEKLGAVVQQLGAGFTWTKTPEEHRTALESAWKTAKECIEGGEYDLIILDELNNALAIDSFPIHDILPLNEVIEVLLNRPASLHVLITGRDAKDEIKAIADLVSVIEAEKHYYDEGVNAIYGIEY
ncbi:cob(I)yrinic acid a,c-diamide adenosyltransferase [Peribacillus deserti]|uniref:Cob(I)yrinic acid a,c-diamide adenosyltransferase n=1 Tax=Peribacillus deserti TaxID=673318 RepID=A0A2N5M8W9_9BACI|nr:cob(I)yrinic acid a,c-diamide adenosyltransferase [Peribacillus deserti]PLT30808.1 cob(I)yrinic acid a,c-diamide adenosyltransferase [Peribacillus deserti]